MQACGAIAANISAALHPGENKKIKRKLLQVWHIMAHVGPGHIAYCPGSEPHTNSSNAWNCSSRANLSNQIKALGGFWEPTMIRAASCKTGICCGNCGMDMRLIQKYVCIYLSI